MLARLILAAAAILPPSSPQISAPPIEGLHAADLHDSFDQIRGQGRHEAIDILEPLGTPVHAVEDGVVAKLFLSKRGGNTIYQFDPTATFCYYYAHLDHYRADLREGMHVARGEVIGYVGATGDADAAAPHLHFTIFRLGPEKHWWQGTPINPYPLLLSYLKSRS
jgi:murein DD-endopeptidase MepM/ murein hydrolase activator NlpD